MKVTFPGRGWHAMFLVSFQPSVPCQCRVVSCPYQHTSTTLAHFKCNHNSVLCLLVGFYLNWVLCCVCLYFSGVVGNYFQNCKEGILYYPLCVYDWVKLVTLYTSFMILRYCLSMQSCHVAVNTMLFNFFIVQHEILLCAKPFEYK